MRQPLESGEIWVSRATAKAVFPSDFQLIAAMNPCPCGYSAEPRCTCSPDKINRYQSRISGPLLDRIDLHIQLNRAEQRISTAESNPEETSLTIKSRVIRARNRQHRRQGKLNHQLSPAEIQVYLDERDDLASIAQRAMEKMDLSMRAVHRAFRVALTISDLANKNLQTQHLMEALSYRPLPSHNH